MFVYFEFLSKIYVGEDLFLKGSLFFIIWFARLLSFEDLNLPPLFKSSVRLSVGWVGGGSGVIIK